MAMVPLFSGCEHGAWYVVAVVCDGVACGCCGVRMCAPDYIGEYVDRTHITTGAWVTDMG